MSDASFELSCPRCGREFDANEPGTVLTCTDGRGCRLRIEEPCPHGETYTCACGQELVATA